ncbi:hypothetical protein THAOC_25993 [Thalassiosira oceanica]|uniref:Uncharacterized protein n=1 Tax=Thalassiosira oceanica TaxID=159749 RepID=K0S680_THAOC|nr:hypothetical protein THAOC_25993 [Thalassiosira oceanica]|eukprot:EJK54382.1 hypothetical protein THAOC_25993 [Thalassiosira oceanica]
MLDGFHRGSRMYYWGLQMACLISKWFRKLCSLASLLNLNLFQNGKPPENLASSAREEACSQAKPGSSSATKQSPRQRQREQRRNQVRRLIFPIPSSSNLMSATCTTKQSRRLCRIGRTLIDDADEDPAQEEPSSGYDCGRDDLGLFMDICTSICSAPPAERLERCGGSGYAYSCNSVCTAETESSSSTASTILTQCVSNHSPPLSGVAGAHSRKTATSSCSVSSDSSLEVHMGETKEMPPSPLELQHPQLRPRSLTPPSSLNINGPYDEQLLSEITSSWPSIVESMSMGATESTFISRQQEGTARTEQSTSSTSDSCGTKNSATQSCEERWKEYRNRSIQGLQSVN